ncbi:MEDS domain-containing protein [Pseudonocardia artemisiae]
MSGLDGARPGAVDVESLLSTYRTDAVVQPHDQVRAYAEATTDALASGFTGLRVAAEVTQLVRSPEQRDAFARYEHLIDRYMTSEPFSAMCAYDRSELGSAAVAETACMHPNATEGAAPFRLHAATDAAAALGGEVDLLGLDLFVRAAGRVDLVPDGGEVVLDASELTFIDHRGLLALANLARRLGVTVVLRTSLRTAHRLVDLLGIQGVRVERPA